MWDNFEIVGPYNTERTPALDAQDTLNLYTVIDPLGKKPKASMGTPGLRKDLVVQIGTDPARAFFLYKDVLYGVFGSNFYSFSTTLVPAFLGSITTTTGFVRMSGNDSPDGQILIVDGQKGYLYNVTMGTFAQITAPGFPSIPIDCAFFGGYFLVCNGNSIKVSYSALNDGTLWDVFSFFSVNRGEGLLVGLGVVNSRVFIFKTLTAEAWVNTGTNVDLPFEPDPGLIFDSGCLAAWSIQYEFGYLFWISRDKSGVSSILMTQGQSVNVISTPAVATKLRTFKNPSEVQSYIYKEIDHYFYVCSWTDDDFTFVADINTNEWHRMEMLPTKVNNAIPYSGKVRHLSCVHAYYNGVHYVGSYKGPIIYSMSLDYGTNDGEPIRRQRVGQYFISKTYKYLQIDALQIDFVNEVTDENGPPAQVEPQAYLSVSKNGGRSFGNERSAPMGKAGQYTTRSIWRLFGVNRDFIFKVSLYSYSPRVFILGASIQYTELES